MILIPWLVSAPAQAQSEIGTTAVIYTYHDDGASGLSAVHATLATANNGEVWFAVEYDDSGDIPPPESLDEPQPELDLFWWNETTYAKQDLGNDRLDEALAFMYPSVVTFKSDTGVLHDYVYVLGKTDSGRPDDECDVSYPCAYLESFRQDAQDMTTGWDRTQFAGVNAGIAHGRPYLSAESITESYGTMYGCWVSSTPDSGSDPFDNTRQKAKDPSVAWMSGTTETISDAANEIEDHCMTAHDDLGWTFTSWHKCDSPTGNPPPNACGSTSEIWVKTEQFDRSTDTWGVAGASDFELTFPAGISNADFPTISIHPQAWDADPPWHAVFADDLGSTTKLVFWTCEGSESACDSAGDWTGAVLDPRGPAPDNSEATTPHVVWANDDLVVAYKSSNGDIGISAWCDWDSGSTSFTDEGVVDRLSGYDAYLFSPVAGTPVSPISYDWEDDNIHLAFIGRHTSSGHYNPMHWYVDRSVICPP